MTDESIWVSYRDEIATWPKAGAVVRYTTKTARSGSMETIHGEGVVGYIGAGMAPLISIVDGPYLHPTLGDTFEILSGGTPKKEQA
jgi:hypothetical protein